MIDFFNVAEQRHSVVVRQADFRCLRDVVHVTLVSEHTATTTNDAWWLRHYVEAEAATKAQSWGKV